MYKYAFLNSLFCSIYLFVYIFLALLCFITYCRFIIYVFLDYSFPNLCLVPISQVKVLVLVTIGQEIRSGAPKCLTLPVLENGNTASF